VPAGSIVLGAIAGLAALIAAVDARRADPNRPD